MFLQAQYSACGGKLPPKYASAYERVRAEFELRGVQLVLFPPAWPRYGVESRYPEA